MSIYSMIGATIVIFALISYSIAIWKEQRKRLVNRTILQFLTIGLFLDITATIFMIVGSSNGPFTLHGFLGYTSLGGMIIDTALIWKFYKSNEPNTRVPVSLHSYTRYAYIWWVLAFFTGLFLVAVR